MIQYQKYQICFRSKHPYWVIYPTKAFTILLVKYIMYEYHLSRNILEYKINRVETTANLFKYLIWKKQNAGAETRETRQRFPVDSPAIC